MGKLLQGSRTGNVYQNHGGQHIHDHGANEGQENRDRCSYPMCPGYHCVSGYHCVKD